MEEELKRKMISRYFERTINFSAVIPLLLIVFGVVMLLLAQLIVGLSLLAVGLIFFRTKPTVLEKPSDQQIDEWLEEDLRKLGERAIAEMGVNKNDLISSSEYIITPPNIGEVEVRFVVGGDNVIRYNPVSVTILNFTRNQLLIYSCIFDMVSGKPTRISGHEIFYESIASMTVQERLVKSKGPDQIERVVFVEDLSITTTGGTTVQITLSDTSLVAKAGRGTIRSEGSYQALQKLRKIIRERRS